MQEKILNNKKHGMLALILTVLFYLAGIGVFVLGAVKIESDSSVLYVLAMVFGGLIMGIGWIPFMGLRVLKPQEALVLTLFGKYIGTIKNEGFYFINPFCQSVNPAAKTKLNQSGDVNGGSVNTAVKINASGEVSFNAIAINNKISLKIMTLNNSRQKINDCLGNPVEIGIAVMWKVVDTAKAVFNVDNYKEYLSLQ